VGRPAARSEQVTSWRPPKDVHEIETKYQKAVETQGGSSREAEGFSVLKLKSAFLDAMDKQHIKNIPVRVPVIKAMAWLK
jgi:hypothetical protein